MKIKYLTTDEAAKIILRSPDTLKVWRSIGKGPKYLKDGCGKIWYTEEDLEKFIKGDSR